MKYGNKKTEVDGIVFDSKKEATRYQELRLLERAGAIGDLELQPKYPIEVNGTKICTYIGDFRYRDPASKYNRTIEDVKGIKTPVYRLKKKLMKAIYGIEIQEI